MTARANAAIEVLRAGGYFRKALETAFRGEKFFTRLRTKGGTVVPGIGFATLEELRAAGLMRRRECASSSTWPEEYELEISTDIEARP